MSDARDREERLSRLLEDTVSGIEPADRLAQIRQGTARPGRRRWQLAGGAALVAAAATVATIAVVTDSGGAGDDDPPVAAEPPASRTLAAYYVGPGPDGPDAPAASLYRYFEDADDPLELLMRTPADPDYRTLWPEGSLGALEESDPAGEVVSVEITAASLRARPADFSRREAELAVQQVVYTVQAAARERVAVQFTLAGNPVDRVYGVPTAEPITDSPPLDVLSLMSISDPGEGTTYDGTFLARGVSNGFEASVYCRLLAQDGTLAWDAPTTAEGWMADRLFPWEVEVDLADVEPGTYTFTCQTDDPTGGAEGSGSAVDTRRIIVE